MAKKTEETTSGPRRSTYVEPNSLSNMRIEDTEKAQGVANAETLRTIAEAREAQMETLREQLAEAQRLAKARLDIITHMSNELAEAQEALTELKKAPRGVEVEAYEYVDHDKEAADAGESYIVVQIDAPADAGRIKVYVNDGVVYDGNPESEDSEESPAPTHAAAFFRTVEEHLDTHGRGPQEVLQKLMRLSSIERVVYLTSLDRVANAMQQTTDNLRDLYRRSQAALAVIE